MPEVVSNSALVSPSSSSLLMSINRHTTTSGDIKYEQAEDGDYDEDSAM